MAIAFQGSSHYEQSGGGSWSGKAALTLSATANAIIVVQTGFNSSGSLTDDSGNGNSYTALTPYQSNGGYDLVIWYSIGGTYPSGMTFSFSGATFASIAAYGFSGVGAFDTGKVSGNNTGSASQQPGSLTPNNASSLFVSGVVSSNLTAGDLSIDSSFTGLLDNKGTDIQTAGAYLIQSGGPTGVNPTWTSGTASGIRATFMAVFTPSGGGGGGSATLAVPSLPLVGIQ